MFQVDPCSQPSIWIIHPSKNDDGVTQQMIEACNCLGIVFLDHLIVSTDDYYSYREETDLLV